MKKGLFSLVCLLLLALSASARVYIPLVKNVPPGTSSGGEARTQIRDYSPLVYYENNSLFIQYPFTTSSSVIISNDTANLVNKDFEDASCVQFDVAFLNESSLYKITINAYDNSWDGYLDLYYVLYREQTIRLGEEQDITLRIGESRKLLFDPTDAEVSWWENLNISVDPVLIIDKDGLVTALRSGTSYVRTEPFDNNKPLEYFPVTVVENGSIRKGQKRLDSVDECEWKDVQYTLTEEGKFIAEGTYYGNGARPDYLNYIVTDQCVFLDFDINYEDSSKMFYPQPFNIEIDSCNAQKYKIYLGNRAQMIESQDNYVKYTIARGSSTAGHNQSNTDAYYNGSSIVGLVEIPNKMFIRKRNEIIQDYINTLLDSKIDGTFQILWIADDICKVILDGDLITNDIIDGLIKNDAVLEASYVYVPKDDYDLYINNGCPESMEVMISIPTNVYQAKDDEMGKVYYNLSGSRIDSPSGLTIVVTRYNDGSVHTEKKLFR